MTKTTVVVIIAGATAVIAAALALHMPRQASPNGTLPESSGVRAKQHSSPSERRLGKALYNPAVSHRRAERGERMQLDGIAAVNARLERIEELYAKGEEALEELAVMVNDQDAEVALKATVAWERIYFDISDDEARIKAANFAVANFSNRVVVSEILSGLRR